MRCATVAYGCLTVLVVRRAIKACERLHLQRMEGDDNHGLGEMVALKIGEDGDM